MPSQRLAGRERVLARVKAIVEKHLEKTGARVYLFGSWARGEERAGSDIDVAVCYEAPLPQGLLTALRQDLEESTIPYRVEIVDLGSTDETFREQVLKEGRLWIG